MLAPAYHPLIGGAESYIRSVSRSLAERGHDIMLVTDGSRVSAGAGSEDGQALVERLGAYTDLLDDPAKLRWEQMYFSLTGEIAQVVEGWGAPDVVFANSHETAILGSMVSDSLNVPLVANFHEQEPETGPLGKGRARLVYGRLPVRAMIAGSHFYLDKAIDHGSPPESTHMIHHGIDCGRFATDGPRRPDGRFVIVLSGRIAPRKQQHMMLRVLHGLVEHGVNAHLVVAGRAHSSDVGYYDAMLELVRELDLSDRVRVRTDLSLNEMPDVYRECDAVVQPSTAEGLGLAVLEAMAAGRPVAVSDTTGLREIVRDQRTGVRLPPDSEEAWVEALARLADDSELRGRLAGNGLLHVRTEFDIGRMIDETESLLHHVRGGWNYFTPGK